MRPGTGSALTGHGLAAIGFAVLVAMAAVNTGANLLFLCFGLLAGTLAVSWVSGRRRLGAIAVSLELPPLIEAERDFGGVLVLDPCAGGGLRSIHVTSALLLPAGGVRLEALAAPRRVVFAGTAPARGPLTAITMTLATRAPFHLVEHRRQVTRKLDVDVYPRLLEATSVARREPRPGPQDAPGPGSGGSLRNLRPYAPGDNPRHVHWRASARRAGRTDGFPLLVREFHAERELEVVVSVASGLAGEAFEQALSAAASAVRDHLLAGLRIELRVPAGVGGHVIHLAQPVDLARALHLFARLEPSLASPVAVAAGRRPEPRGPRRKVLAFGETA